jgi:enamine deaminase RidA (YjgF/YER057c/UK114 family)
MSEPMFEPERTRVSSGHPYELIMGYSRAVRVDDRVFVSGTAPINADGTVDPQPDEQLRRCFEIIERALMEVSASLRDVVRTRIYLVDVNDAPVVERVHGALFADIRPANTTVVVASLLNPAFLFEVEVDAVVGVRDREHVRGG